MAQTWGVDLIDRIGEQVARRRTALDLSAQQVADRTAELGHPVSRSAIADLSNPRRPSRLTVPDWLVLAAALEMPPLALLFPGLPAGEVEPLPGWKVPALRAAHWAAGIAQSAPGHPSSGPWFQYARTADDYLDAVMEWNNADIQVTEFLPVAEDATERERAFAMLRAAESRLARVRGAGELLRQLGMNWLIPDDPNDFLVRYVDIDEGDGPADG